MQIICSVGKVPVECGSYGPVLLETTDENRLLQPKTSSWAAQQRISSLRIKAAGKEPLVAGKPHVAASHRDDLMTHCWGRKAAAKTGGKDINEFRKEERPKTPGGKWKRSFLCAADLLIPACFGCVCVRRSDVCSVLQTGRSGQEASRTHHPHRQLPDPHLSPAPPPSSPPPQTGQQLAFTWGNGSNADRKWNHQLQQFLPPPLTLKICSFESRDDYIYICDFKSDVWQVRALNQQWAECLTKSLHRFEAIGGRG